MNKATLIINLDSGTGKARELEDEIADKIKENYDEVEVKETQKGGDATRFASEARVAGVDAVFAAGGDGTISEVVRGLLADCAEGEPLPTLGMFPGGTGNGLMRTLGLPRTIEDTLAQSNFKKTKCIDAGYVNDRPFVYTVTLGSLPEGIREVSSEEKSHFGPLAYAFSEIKKIGQNKTHKLVIKHDGEEETLEVNSLVIFSANVMANQVLAEDETKSDDGWLHMLILKDASLGSMLELVPTALSGDIEESDQIRYIKAHTMKVSSPDEELECGIDGDEGVSLPISLRIEPKKLSIFID